MAQQTTYNNNSPAALAGMVRWTEGTRVWSKIVDPAAAAAVNIGMLAYYSASMSVPGLAVSLAAQGEAGTIIPFPSGTITADPMIDANVVGIPILDTAYGAGDQCVINTVGANTYSAIKQAMPVSLLRKGEIWVPTDAAVTQYADVYVYTTTAGNFPAGMFAAGSGANRSKFPHGRWLMTTAAAGLALMEIW